MKLLYCSIVYMSQNQEFKVSQDAIPKKFKK